MKLEIQKITLATKITILRIILVPIIIFAMINQYWNFAFWLIIISAISDFMDGTIARMRNETTPLGACLDPIADKLFILSCYFILSLGYLPTYSLPFWFTWLVFFKEIFLVLGAAFIYSLAGELEVKPTWLGKITMDIQTIFIISIFMNHIFNLHFAILNTLLLYTIVFLVLSSFLQYAKISIEQFEQNNV